MPTAFTTLKVNRHATDQEIRAKYLELVRRFPPETHPKEANDIRAAYDQIRTLEFRVQYLLEHEGKEITFEEIAAKLSQHVVRKRPTLQQLCEVA